MARLNSFCPLRITAHVRTPVICDGLLPLDGILLSIKMRESYGFIQTTLSGEMHPLRDRRTVSMPLLIRYHGTPSWYYACSNAQWDDPCIVGHDHWSKRLDQAPAYMIDFQGKRGNVKITGGFYRGYRQSLDYYASRTIRWYVVGDKDLIENLLRFATHIGKKTSQGWGRIARWTVETWRDDMSCWDGVHPMRPIPVDVIAEADRSKWMLRYTAFRPPGWNPKNQAWCAVSVK